MMSDCSSNCVGDETPHPKKKYLGLKDVTNSNPSNPRFYFVSTEDQEDLQKNFVPHNRVLPRHSSEVVIN